MQHIGHWNEIVYVPEFLTDVRPANALAVTRFLSGVSESITLRYLAAAQIRRVRKHAAVERWDLCDKALDELYDIADLNRVRIVVRGGEGSK